MSKHSPTPGNGQPRPVTATFPLGQFDAILLDMNATFMFGHDRLDPGQDYHATYQSLGGSRLGRKEVHRIVIGVCEELSVKYEDVGYQETFPSVLEVTRSSLLAQGLPDSEKAKIVDTIAIHELGDIPDEYVQALKELARAHKLAVVSNLWSMKSRWIQRFKQRGVLEWFESLVFSSDGPHVKPSAALFWQALKQLKVEPSRALFIGDDCYRDMAGASALGMTTVLVGQENPSCKEADWQSAHLVEFAGLIID